MNDTELDEMLDRWKTPPMRESLRDEVRVRFALVSKRPERFAVARTIFVRMAVGTACAAALLFAIVQVSPRIVRMASSGYHIPFYVESEFVRYGKDGLPAHRTRMTAFPYAGIAINMSVMESGNSVLDPFRNMVASIRTQVILAMPSLVLPKQPAMQEPAWFAGYVRSGCSERKTVIGHETVAGHETTIIESPTPRGRFRFWLAPDLACFALKSTLEAEQPDGSYRFESRSEALKVTMNP